MASEAARLFVQDNHTSIDVQDLNTAGKLYKWLFPVSVAPNDQRRAQSLHDLTYEWRTAMSANGIVWAVVREQNVRPMR